MITFLDENDVEYGALATIKATNAVNGERSLTGTIVSGDYVLSKIERGWRLRFDDEYYVVTFAKPIDEGKNVQVSFDAVHQFFWDFGKSSVYDQLSDGSHTFRAYLDFIFNDSGYRYDIESSLTVKAFEKQSFGYKNRLSLFNDIITSSGVEFQVNGKVVRILAKVGTDLSTVVRKNFNLNELGIEKNIGNFVTYQKGFGAYFDEEDHSKGRLIAEYTSPLASVYGKLEADPLVDERYKQQESLLSALKETVDNSYTISVSLDMEDLTRAGYRYTQPVAGDYIMAINETLGFKEKIRIVSFTSEYDVAGQLIKHTVTCNDIGSVKKLSASYTHTQHQAANAEENANTAYEFANKALVSANGKNTNYYGDTFPVDNPKGTLKKGDLLFLTVGDTVKQYYWNGAEWVTNPVVSDVEAFKEQISEELKDVPNREEFENKIAEELATSKAEITTQIETAKTQAESNAKEYADTINQETAKVAEQANAATDEIKADLVNVKNNLTSTSIVANNAQAAVDAAKQELAEVNTKVDSAKEELTQAKQDLTEVASDLNTAKQDLADSVDAVNTKVDSTKAELTQAKQDLTSHAQQLQTQANAQTELTKRVTTVETTANGTKTTVNELTKTVAQNGKDITSVTNRTKTVEDDLANTKTTLTQVQTTANSASQKTATLETGLNGLNAKFSNLKIGGTNLLLYSSDPWQAPSGYYQSSGAVRTDEMLNGSVVYKTRSIWSRLAMNWGKHLIDRPDVKVGDEFTYSVYVRTDQESPIKARLFFRYSGQSSAEDMTGEKTITQEWQRFTKTFTVTQKMLSDSSKLSWVGFEQTSNSEDGKFVYYACNKLERGNIVTDYSPNDADLEQKVAEYRQTADQNYASLSSTVQTLDGTVTANKATADQTAQGFSTRIESLETYKDGESERANAYFESAKTETAKQLTAERTAIANNYVAKSTYTSDVTGIRNDLSATTTTANTTKTNLANYQASNDRAVANLQSNIQTANGDISSLKTKVEAVPGQITSAVSAVEGKIPTSVGSVNLFKGSRDFSGTSWLNNNSSLYAEDYKGVKIFKTQTMWDGLSQYFEVKTGEEYVFSAYVKSSAKTDRVTFFLNDSQKQPQAGGTVSFDSNSGRDSVDLNLTDKYQRITIKIKIISAGWIMPRLERFNSDAYLFFGGYKLEHGNVATDWTPAPEDTVNQINNLSSQIQQTADGMTLLATKTELNTAKNELQSGINTATNKANTAQNTANNNAQTISTHTTQISALNTGLQAKVSQTDFNTLSGRVTSAENNITAKANELSSKITSVEGKIPTSVGATNLLLYTADPWKAPSDYYQFSGVTKTDKTLNGSVVYKTNTAWSSLRLNLGKQLIDRRIVKVGEEFTYSVWMRTDQVPMKVRLFARYSGQSNAEGLTEEIALTNEWQKFSVTFKVTQKMVASQTKLSWVGFEQTTNNESGKYVYYACNKLERGNIATGYSPAPEDTAEQISTLSSQIKQTADGITLLATKTELNTAKNELQSGINTATNKANNNAQTISTHTTQISALNTGLQAKVSQTDFNTLSGRVTSAENNITAKANELTSKITSVEGKIPTSVGSVNLFKGSRDFSGTDWIGSTGEYAEDYQGVKIFKKQTLWSGRSQYFEVKTGEEYVFSAYVKSSAKTDRVTFFLNDSQKQPTASGVVSFGSLSSTNTVDLDLTDEYKRIAIKIKITKDGWIAPRIERFNSDNYLFFGGYKLERGNVATDWTPAPEDTAEQINSVSSEFKQTTDAIKASVQSLDNNTVKSSSLTINTDGVVIKAGKSTSDFANAVGSYFAVNQNAINLFSDKINVKGNMIVSGAITSDKIASKQINTSHLNGKIITADVISSNAVTADAIKAGAVTTDKMSANSINGDRIAAGTLDAAKIKAGSITASQIASGTITSNQIKAGTISSANIAAGAITGDKIAAGAIDANKIAANAITANMIRGGQLNSTNGATSFDLNAGTLTFNNDYGYIQRVASDKVFEITTVLGKNAESQDFLTSDFTIRKSDFSRQAGAKFTLYNATADKPTARATIHADELVLFDSQNTTLLSILAKGSLSNFNFQGWGDIPVAQLPSCGLMVKDIGIGGYTKSLQKIVEELCRKTGVLWI